MAQPPEDQVPERTELLSVTVGMVWREARVSCPHRDILRAYRGLRNGRLTLPDLERHLTRAILHRRDRDGPRACAIALTRILSFAKDIDTLAELQQVCSQQ